MRADSETTETVEECVGKADSATDAEKVCDEATLEENEECGDDQGTGNMSGEEYGGVVEEIIDEEAENPQDGQEEDDEFRDSEEQVGSRRMAKKRPVRPGTGKRSSLRRFEARRTQEVTTAVRIGNGDGDAKDKECKNAYDTGVSGEKAAYTKRDPNKEGGSNGSGEGERRERGKQ
ncbi:hypothetical protein MTO96_032255 [Rhipicephalus appendiculatus]